MSENKKPSEKLINSIKNWVFFDDKIRKLKDEMKDLSQEKKNFEEIVLDELSKMEEDVISITDGKLRKTVIKTQSALKKENIQKTIFEFTKDEQKTFDIIEKIMISREVKEKVNLKRTKDKDTFIKNPAKEI